MRVAIVGGGVVGLCTAWYLARGGAEVVVIDRGRMGDATSRGNAGWIVPSLTAPLSAPGSVRQGARLMLRRDNPFYIRPRLSSALARWLFSFWRESRSARFSANVSSVYALGRRTLALFDELAEAGVEFEMHSQGLIFLCVSEAALEGAAARIARLVELGYKGAVEQLDGPQVRAREPAVGGAVVGGIHLKQERHVRPETLTTGLVSALAAAGVELVEGCRVAGVVRARSGWEVDGDGERIGCDRVVLAAGIWTNELLRPLGLRLAMEAGKGYSLTTRGEGIPPRHALYMVEPMVGVSPYRDSVRLAGMVELSGMDLSLHRGRLDALARAADTYFSGWRPAAPELEWAGLRPLSPDGLPFVGAAPGRPGLFVSTGHGMTGLTLAPASASALAPLVLEDRLVPELLPFRVDRPF